MTIQNTGFKTSVKHKKGKTIFYTLLLLLFFFSMKEIAGDNFLQIFRVDPVHFHWLIQKIKSF